MPAQTFVITVTIKSEDLEEHLDTLVTADSRMEAVDAAIRSHLQFDPDSADAEGTVRKVKEGHYIDRQGALILQVNYDCDVTVREVRESDVDTLKEYFQVINASKSEKAEYPGQCPGCESFKPSFDNPPVIESQSLYIGAECGDCGTRWDAIFDFSFNNVV